MKKKHRENNLPHNYTFCAGKKCYPTHAEAARDAKFIRRRSEDCVREFWCRACKAWHVGSSGETPRNLRKEEDDENQNGYWY